MKNTVGRGAFILIVSGIVCKFFGALFRLPLTNIIGLQGIGLFQMVMSLYSLTLVFVSGGVTNAMSKLVSTARARGDVKAIGGYYRYALLFSLGIGFAFGLFFIIFSSAISSLQGAAEASSSYMMLAALLPLGGLIGVFRGIIQGFENMTPTAVSQVLEQVGRFVFGLIFAYLFAKNGEGAGVFGAFLGITVAEAFALAYLTVLMQRRVKLKPQRAPVRSAFFHAVVPLTLSGTVAPLTVAVESLIIVSLLTRAGMTVQTATTLYGLQSGVVGAILHFPLVISVSVAVALLPKISYLSATRDTAAQQRVVRNAFNIMWFLLIPLVMGIIAIARVLYPIIYPSVINEYLAVAEQLTLLGGISIVLSALMQLLNALLLAKGYFSYSLVFNLTSGFFKIITLLIFAPLSSVNIYAIPISNIVMYSIVCICALLKLGRLVRFKLFNFALPFMSALIMAMVVRLWLSYLGGIWGIVTAVLLGAVVYFCFCMPLVYEYVAKFWQKIRPPTETDDQSEQG